MSRDERRFEDAWRRHAARPPTLSPEEAAGRVLHRLAQRPTAPRRRPLRLAAAAALVAVVIVAAALVRLSLSPTVPQRAGEVAETAVTPEGTVVLWLDEETPLYLTLEPPADGGADRKETLQ